MSSDMVYMGVTRKHKLDVFRLEPQLAYRSFDHSSGARHAGIEQNVPEVVMSHIFHRRSLLSKLAEDPARRC